MILSLRANVVLRLFPSLGIKTRHHVVSNMRINLASGECYLIRRLDGPIPPESAIMPHASPYRLCFPGDVTCIGRFGGGWAAGTCFPLLPRDTVGGRKEPIQSR